MKKFYLTSVTASAAMALLAVTGCTDASTTIADKSADNNAINSLPFYATEDFTPNWIEANSPALENFHQIPAFSFTDQNGIEITEHTFDNKIFVANFFFSTCPGICPTIRTKLAKVQEVFIDDDAVKLISHSIRPTNDTVEVLQTYAKDNSIDSKKWHLVTGDKNEIYDLAKNFYFANENLGDIQDNKDFLHTENVLLIDQNRHIRGVYNGLNKASVDYLIADIKTLKAEIGKL